MNFNQSLFSPAAINKTNSKQHAVKLIVANHWFNFHFKGDPNVGHRADFTDADLAGIKFDKMRLPRVSFRGANLRRASFIEADLNDVDFSHVVSI